jgi:chitinase
MRKENRFFWTRVLLGVLALASQVATALPSVWVSGYFYGANLGTLAPSQVDFSTLTHVMHFQLEPQSNGTLLEGQLCASSCSNTNLYSAELIYRAHLSGAKVLITIGGAGFEAAFRSATSTDASTNAFVANIISFFNRSRAYNGVPVDYDGIDIDWEPIGAYGARYQSLITKLRQALDGLGRPERPLLTTAVSTPYGDPSVIDIVNGVQASLDQINVMTYPYAGSWSVWHISPLTSSPSIHGNMPEFAAKIPAAKLGFGIDFDALRFRGFSAPTPSQGTAQSDSEIQSTYRQMMAAYYNGQPGPSGTVSSGIYRWDSNANAPYLSIAASGTNPAYYVSFENETSLQLKVDYAQDHGYGGVIIWQLAGGYRPDRPAGSRDELMQAIKIAAGLGGSSPNPDTEPPTVAVTSPFNGDPVSGTIALSASASDNIQVASVQFQVDGANLGAPIAAAPYNFPGGLNTTTLTNGAHTLTAIATDTSGLSATSSVSVSVSNPIPAGPTVAITSPTEGTHVGSPVKVQVATGGNVVKVQLFVDGGLVTTSTTSPFVTTWYPPKKITGTPHTLQTKAFNAAGVSILSSPVKVYR